MGIVPFQTGSGRATTVALDSDRKKRTSAQGHVRFAPESRHVRCNYRCLHWAKSGHACVYSLRETVRACAKTTGWLGVPSS
jgi:hypothetical protein